MNRTLLRRAKVRISATDMIKEVHPTPCTPRRTLSAKGGKQDVLAVTSGGPNGMALGPDGALYVCNSGGFSGPGVVHKRPFPSQSGGELVSGLCLCKITAPSDRIIPARPSARRR